MKVTTVNSVQEAYNLGYEDGFNTAKSNVIHTRFIKERTCTVYGETPMTDDEKLFADMRIASCSCCRKQSIDIRFGYCPHCGAKVVE